MSNEQSLELAPRAQMEVATQQSGGLTIEQAFRAVVEGQLDSPKLEVMQKLLAMDAERKFNAAFVALQADMPVIIATTEIKNRGKYAKFEDIMDKIGPLLTRHGFTVSFSQDCKDSRILETCTLSHAAGHSRSNTFAVRTGLGDTNTQVDCKAATTAKRNALCNALNIVVKQDCMNNEDDAGIVGDPNAFVTEAQATELEHRVKMLGVDVVKFLQYGGAKTFATIPSNRYGELDQSLRRKESKGK